jgi:hypothetical protein
MARQGVVGEVVWLPQSDASPRSILISRHMTKNVFDVFINSEGFFFHCLLRLDRTRNSLFLAPYIDNGTKSINVFYA